MPTCIWCKRATGNEPEEHVLLESLGGDQPFYLPGGVAMIRLVLSNDEVCGICNTRRLKLLDDYLIKQLGIFKVFLNRYTTKAGKPPKVERPGVYGVRRKDGAYVLLNANNDKILADDGHVVYPARDHPEAVRVARLEEGGAEGQIEFTQPIRLNKRTSRAVHKIAFEMLCFQEGADYVLHPRFDSIREYVLDGRGSRALAIKKTVEAEEWQTPPKVSLLTSPNSDEWIVKLALGLHFHVDLSPRNVLLLYKEEHLEELGLVRIIA